MKKLDLDYDTCQKLPQESWTKEEVVELCRRAFNEGELTEAMVSTYDSFGDWYLDNI